MRGLVFKRKFIVISFFAVFIFALSSCQVLVAFDDHQDTASGPGGSLNGNGGDDRTYPNTDDPSGITADKGSKEDKKFNSETVSEILAKEDSGKGFSLITVKAKFSGIEGGCDKLALQFLDLSDFGTWQDKKNKITKNIKTLNDGDGYEFMYAHTDEVTVSENDKVYTFTFDFGELKVRDVFDIRDDGSVKEAVIIGLRTLDPTCNTIQGSNVKVELIDVQIDDIPLEIIKAEHYMKTGDFDNDHKNSRYFEASLLGSFGGDKTVSVKLK